MSWFDRGKPSAAPTELSAAERIQGPRCRACRTPDVPMVAMLVDGDAEVVCEDPRACRQRAQAAGIYGVVVGR